MTGRRLALGRAGEAAAEQYLRQKGYGVVARNLRLGRLGELDLICRDGQCLVFVEVKTKIAGEALGGFGNITLAKQRKLSALAVAYIQQTGVKCPARFDAIEVEYPSQDLHAAPLVRHVADAFRCA